MRNFTALLFASILFAISGTAFADNVKKAPVYILQKIEDCYTAMLVPARAASVECESLFSGLLQSVQSWFTVPRIAGLTISAGIITYAVCSNHAPEGFSLAAVVTAWDWKELKDRVLTAFPGYSNNDMFITDYRREIVVEDNKSTYQFKFNKIQNSFVTEQLLEENDVCVVGQIGMFLIARDTTKEASVTLLTYDSATQLATDAGGTQADYRIFYNGRGFIKTGITTTRNFLTQDFYYSPGAALAQNLLATGGGAAATVRDQRGQDDGYLWVGGNAPIFSGRADQNITIEVNPFAGIDIAADTSGWTVNLVVCLRGYTIFNAAMADNVKKAVEYGFLDRPEVYTAAKG